MLLLPKRAVWLWCARQLFATLSIGAVGCTNVFPANTNFEDEALRRGAEYLEVHLHEAPLDSVKVLALHALRVVSPKGLKATGIDTLRERIYDARLVSEPDGLRALSLVIPLLRGIDLDGDPAMGQARTRLIAAMLARQNRDDTSTFFGGYACSLGAKEDLFTTFHFLEALAGDENDYRNAKDDALAFVKACQHRGGDEDGGFFWYPTAYAENEAKLQSDMGATFIGLYVLERYGRALDAVYVQKTKSFLSRRGSVTQLLRSPEVFSFQDEYALSICVRFSLIPNSSVTARSLPHSLVRRQCADGSWRGTGRWDSSPVVATSLAIITLENCRVVGECLESIKRH